ncbi:MAG: universal stress protein [Acidimicrobiia bacterium]|nr:universal stress protein [Acidimicrobiia bacterium]
MKSAPKKILVPVDLSPRSEIAVSYAAMLADATKASLVVMLNINLPEQEVLEELAAAEHLTLEQAAETALHRVGSLHAPYAEISSVIRMKSSPADAILEVVDTEAADMIVLASHGRSGMSRWWLGSVAEKVSRHSHVPLVIVPAREREQT